MRESVLRVLARYSEGLRLTMRHGVASGIVVEYAYENVPRGWGTIGRWIDRRFLHTPRCHAMRQRVDAIRSLVADLVSRQRLRKQPPVVVLDVAAGTARYLRELAREARRGTLAIRCLDRDPREVILGRQLVSREGLADFTFEVGDATDDASYLMSEDPDIVLAIDLFPYLHDDDAVRQVLHHAFRHLASPGVFVCTGAVAAAPASTADPGEEYGFHIRPLRRPPALLRHWLCAAGFGKCAEVPLGTDDVALIAEKPAA